MTDRQQSPEEHFGLLPGDGAAQPSVDTDDPRRFGAGHRRYQSVDDAPTSSTGQSLATKTRHRKHRSSISELMTSLQSVREEFEETGHLLGSSLLRRLDSMDRGGGKYGYLDMSMTRNLSVLPDDFDDLMEDVTGQEPQDEKIAAAPPLMAYLALLAAVTAVSSNSTALHLLDGVSAPLKFYWRMTASYCALLPFAVHGIHRDGGLPGLSFSQWLAFAAAVVAYSTQNVLFVTALEYTTIGNAVIYANSQALLLILGKAFVGERIHPLEATGVFVAFSGAILCSKDSEGSSEEAGDASSLALFGDLMALAAAIAGVAYLTFAKAVRPHMSVTLFMFSVLFCGSFLVLAYIAITERGKLEFNMDPFTGAFGWLNVSEGRLPVVLYLGIVVNIVGTMGFVRAMHYFENVIISVATLMEPLMASLIAYACNIGLLPGPLGWLGNFLVVAGTMGVVYPSIGTGGGEMH